MGTRYGKYQNKRCTEQKFPRISEKKVIQKKAHFKVLRDLSFETHDTRLFPFSVFALDRNTLLLRTDVITPIFIRGETCLFVLLELRPKTVHLFSETKIPCQ